MHKQVKKGIWRYSPLLPYIDKKYRLTLAEGQTDIFLFDNIFFKCEFDNPSGSVKDRGFAYQFSKLKELGIKKAVLSSSGNAAISALTYAQLTNIKLTVFLSPKTDAEKLKIINKFTSDIVFSKKPLSQAFQFARQSKAYNLRQSLDINARYGYETLSFELAQIIPQFDAVFIPVSSGTILSGLVEGFRKKSMLPSIHAVQTESVNPLSSQFDHDFVNRKTSLASSIVAKYSPLFTQASRYIKETKGFGWVISDKQIKIAHKVLIKYHLNSGFEGAAALAAIWKSREKGFKYKYPVCLLTGKFYGPKTSQHNTI